MVVANLADQPARAPCGRVGKGRCSRQNSQRPQRREHDYISNRWHAIESPMQPCACATRDPSLTKHLTTNLPHSFSCFSARAGSPNMDRAISAVNLVAVGPSRSRAAGRSAVQSKSQSGSWSAPKWRLPRNHRDMACDAGYQGTEISMKERRGKPR